MRALMRIVAALERSQPSRGREHEERGDPLPVRRAFEHLKSRKLSRDRRRVVCALLGKVVERMRPRRAPSNRRQLCATSPS
jgi:hypothetical protein